MADTQELWLHHFVHAQTLTHTQARMHTCTCYALMSKALNSVHTNTSKLDGKYVDASNSGT